VNRTLKITLAYDGTRFVGWQRQAEGESIQGLLEDALARFEGAPVVAHGSGRTDAGVHALGQVASAQVTLTHDAAAVLRGLNAHLPQEIRVLAVEEAPADFHARFSARSKSYEYRIRHARVADPFERLYEWHVTGRLDTAAMRDAARLLVGTHDFAAFRSVGTDPPDTIRTLASSEVMVDGARVVYRTTGDGFLRHMVRAIVGTLVEVGRGWRSVDNMTHLLNGGVRGDAGATAPPHGLFLVRVDYD
jgi:tRNA pseudouridine38-40 synthase